MTELNLPEAPDGYFWRVKSGAFGVLPVVQLRKRVWLWSTMVDEENVSTQKGKSVASSIEDACRRMLLWRSRQDHLYRKLVRLSGDYR